MTALRMIILRAAWWELVIKRVAEFAKGAPQSDDITCIAVVRNER